jgi:hypothetical protein
MRKIDHPKMLAIAAAASLGILTGCGSSNYAHWEPDADPYDTPGSPKTVQLTRSISHFEAPYTTRYEARRYIYDPDGRRYEVLDIERTSSYRAGRLVSPPTGFVYSSNGNLIPVDRYMTEMDRRINREIRHAMREDPTLSPLMDDISLTTINADVTILGEVSSPRHYSELARRAEAVVGQGNVHMRLDVTPS